MNYARVFESFGMFIKLCKETLLGVRNFMVFMIFWVFMFAWLFKVAGAVVTMDDSKSDYAGLEDNLQQLLESFRNSIGDNQIPSKNFWSDKMSNEKEEFGLLSSVMIYYIWFLWLINLTFMGIVLLNLMVAVMSSTYEEALQENFVSKYQFRCEMIVEASLIKETFVWMGAERAWVFGLSKSVIEKSEEEEE